MRPPYPMVGVNSGVRTYFWNHAFIGWNGVIYDGCGGPHLGTEDVGLPGYSYQHRQPTSSGWRHRHMTAMPTGPNAGKTSENTEKFLQSCISTNAPRFSQIHWVHGIPELTKHFLDTPALGRGFPRRSKGFIHFLRCRVLLLMTWLRARVMSTIE
ncbi:hypothetical protein CPB83DRAFT_899220 [Crepidotus variabilis]|uniref:Uncharacterized protein n=1 Tax=Crepidotus variabilis TaxID=179855 RepID=A0A9P6E5H7_9AGAR|nr:hypothetical protein CPB83DRAFT_899220 [Crepidotus variabilis]